MKTMHGDVLDVRILPGKRLWLRFRNGASGEVAVGKLVTFDGVFAPRAEDEFFAGVRIHDETHTVCWPNDADLDSDVLYSLATGTSLPSFD